MQINCGNCHRVKTHACGLSCCGCLYPYVFAQTNYFWYFLIFLTAMSSSVQTVKCHALETKFINNYYYYYYYYVLCFTIKIYRYLVLTIIIIIIIIIVYQNTYYLCKYICTQTIATICVPEICPAGDIIINYTLNN